MNERTVERKTSGTGRTSSRRSPARFETAGSAADRFRRLQRVIGNQAALRVLRSARLQAKLTVSSPDDHCEREADRVADEVMRMAETPAFGRQQSAVSGGGEPLQRKPG